MIINGHTLLELAPIKNMERTKNREHGVSYGLSEAGYDIRIKQDVWFYGQRFNYSPSRRSSIIPSDYGNFIIASAIEEFDMPSNLVGIVHDKSTWAREGLSVFNTVIEPGFKGGLTLELVYHGNRELFIPAGSGIAQVVFHATSDHAFYKGKYQNQSNEPVAAIFERESNHNKDGLKLNNL